MPLDVGSCNWARHPPCTVSLMDGEPGCCFPSVVGEQYKAQGLRGGETVFATGINKG